ncbi:MAG TPA: RND family transporter, partial [Ramlibacter sp.]|nr:RND family transporter [Ramlibacter sp.]
MTVSPAPVPQATRLEDFDTASGNRLERALFNHRGWILLLCLLTTLLLGAQLPSLTLNANFQRMIPTSHSFIRNYLQHEEDLAGQGNVLRIVVESGSGTILDPKYLGTLQKLSDEVYLTPGVNRPFMTSLWTPTMRWRGITEDGLEEGSVIDQSYDGSARALDQVANNIRRSGEIGRIVAPDFQSSLLLVPLMDFDTETGRPLDYATLSERLEELRGKYEAQGVKIHIVGFAKLVGDLIEGLWQVLAFFAAAIVIATVIVYGYTRCVRSTALVMLCSLVAVAWLLGLLPLLRFELDPYTVLVPFLVFAIGMSHGAQKMNGVMQDIGRGVHKLLAARYTFRRLFMAGLAALLCDAVGFAVLL